MRILCNALAFLSMKRLITALVALAAFTTAAFGDAGKQPPLKVVSVEIVAHTPEVENAAQTWPTYPRFIMPHIPASARTHLLDEVVSCGDCYLPIGAWSEVSTTWPSPNVVYTANAGISDQGNIQIILRAREVDRIGPAAVGYDSGYAYIDVIVLCLLRQD